MLPMRSNSRFWEDSQQRDLCLHGRKLADLVEKSFHRPLLQSGPRAAAERR
jgi:hypothetical protein